jgi:hypothetical protein
MRSRRSRGTIPGAGANLTTIAKTTTSEDTRRVDRRYATASSMFETIPTASHARELRMVKPFAARFELPLVAAGLMVGMLLVMWAQRPAATCTLSREAPRQLVLSRATDREHLAADLASADRIARRYVGSSVNSAQQHARFADCEATLVQQIATRHGLSPEHLRGGRTDSR